MNIFSLIDAFTTRHTLICPGQTIIVGLSGGPDSVFLLYYLLSKKTALNLTIIAAHLNHEWRESAQADADFCANLCAQWQTPLISKKISELGTNIKPSGSKEQDARRARRAFFEQLAGEHAADAIALAHHKDDQEETFFIRLFRGTSLSGLVGIQPKNAPYIRPLLCVNKVEILAQLAERNIDFAIDPTNESHDFLRNRIRHKLIPMLNEIDTRFHNSFTNTLERLQETEEFLTRLTGKTFAEISSYKTMHNCYTVDKQAFLSLDPALRYRILVHWLTLEKVSFPVTQAFLDEMLRFIQQPENGSHTLHETWRIIKRGTHFYIKVDNKPCNLP